MNALVHFAEGWWWLALIFGGGITGTVREAFRVHHKRKLALLEAKSRLRAEPASPPEPQAVCGCTHHLSFHNPNTSACAIEGCRCQRYVGPEPLGQVFAQPIVEPIVELDPPEPGDRLNS